VTHTYTQAIKQPTLHYLTRSVRRRAATSKRGNRPSKVLLHISDKATNRELTKEPSRGSMN